LNDELETTTRKLLSQGLFPGLSKEDNENPRRVDKHDMRTWNS